MSTTVQIRHNLKTYHVQNAGCADPCGGGFVVAGRGRRSVQGASFMFSHQTGRVGEVAQGECTALAAKTRIKPALDLAISGDVPEGAGMGPAPRLGEPRRSRTAEETQATGTGPVGQSILYQLPITTYHCPCDRCELRWDCPEKCDQYWQWFYG